MDVSVRDLKNGLSEHLARVRRGERLTVTLRGRPIAEIGPAVAPATLTPTERLQRMADAGDIVLRRQSSAPKDDFAPVRLRKAKSRPGGARPMLTASALILADRE